MSLLTLTHTDGIEDDEKTPPRADVLRSLMSVGCRVAQSLTLLEAVDMDNVSQ